MSDELQATGRVTEILGEGAYRIEFSNGHRCVGRADRKSSPFEVGSQAEVAFHPYDLSRGRIISARTSP